MSDPTSGSGSQVGLPSQQLNVATSTAVHFQHVLSTGGQNLNLLAANGQQFVITSPVSVSNLNQASFFSWQKKIINSLKKKLLFHFDM